MRHTYSIFVNIIDDANIAALMSVLRAAKNVDSGVTLELTAYEVKTLLSGIDCALKQEIKQDAADILEQISK